MRLSDLLQREKGYQIVSGDPEHTVIDAVAIDSRDVTPGTLFICIRGESTDGHRYAGEAVERGASAVVTEYAAGNLAGATVIRVRDSRTFAAAAAAAFYDHPSRALKTAGITGTNGKTTTAFALREILERSGTRTGLLGTICYSFPGETIPAPLTTPDPVSLQRFLHRCRETGCEAVVMEVSSHALEQNRLGPTLLCCAAFTNLSRDHLDYHPDMESYFRTKASIFKLVEERGTPTAAVNVDDPYGCRLVSELNSAGRGVVTFGIDAGSAMIRAQDISFDISHTSYQLCFPGGEKHPVKTRLIGTPTLYNQLCAAALAKIMGVERRQISLALSDMKPVPGRLENTTPEYPFSVIIDYAHTPDGLKKVLEFLVKLRKNRILTLFGCGGDRDRGKRPEMAAVAERMSDIVIVTDDNPRTEDPEMILDDIRSGFSHPRDHFYIHSRRDAIKKGLSLIAPGDIFLVAGKGHEDYQITGRGRQHFSDRETVRELLGEGIIDRTY